MRKFILNTMLLATGLTITACAPTQVQYTEKPSVVRKTSSLHTNLLRLLPEEQRTLEAWEEAKWLADTAYKASAGISRINGSWFPGWSGNALINARLQERGLCWHYQHDMYRELRRRPLKYFRIGCCVRDQARRTEHNCVYIAARDGEWPNAWMLDAWMWNGRLKVDDARKLNHNRWTDLPEICAMLSAVFTEGHGYPIEQWFSVRNYTQTITGQHQWVYTPFWYKSAANSAQLKRMRENIARGAEEHPGKLTNY